MRTHEFAMNEAKEENIPDPEVHEELSKEVLEEIPAETEVKEEVETEAAESVEEAAEVELSIEEQLEKAKAESQENYNSYLRAVADLDNYRRRVNREKDELRQYAVANLLESFLPVYDNMLLGLQSTEQTADPIVVAQGIQMVLTQFKSVLEENGVEEIVPEVGAEFDHNLHEAFQTQPSEEVEEGKVLVCMRRGFSLKGRLVRPANVVVSGGAAKEEEAASE